MHCGSWSCEKSTWKRTPSSPRLPYITKTCDVACGSITMFSISVGLFEKRSSFHESASSHEYSTSVDARRSSAITMTAPWSPYS